MSRYEADEILMGSAPIEAGTEGRDTDGDGVSDVQERLDGTDPSDAADHLGGNPDLLPLDDGDPHLGLDPGGLDRQAIFDKDAHTPAGMTVDRGLDAKNLDGSGLTRDPAAKYDAGKDLLGAHGSTTSPTDMQRDPVGSGLYDVNASAPPKDTGGSDGGAGGSFGSGKEAGGNSGDLPDGVDLGMNAPDSGLVSSGGYVDKVKAKVNESYQGTGSSTTKPDAGTTRPAGDTPIDPKTAATAPKVEMYVPKSVREKEPLVYNTNPDAEDIGGAPTVEAVERAIVLTGSDSTPVRGATVPQTDQDEPPVRYGDLITDGGAENHTKIDTSAVPRSAPDAALIHTINPDTGIVRPTPSGPPPSGGGGTTGQPDPMGGSHAATAATSDGPPAPGITPVGSGGGGGIASVADTGGDDVLGTPPAPAVADTGGDDVLGTPPAPAAPEVAEVADPAADAVDSFTAEYLQDESVAQPEVEPAIVADVDPLTEPLTADLIADAGPVVDEPDQRMTEPEPVDAMDGPDDDGLDGG